MKKIVILASAVLVSSTSIAKVTYDDAVNSTKDYYHANSSVHNPPHITGLGPDEEQNANSNIGNDMGKWKYENKTGYPTSRMQLNVDHDYDSKIKASIEKSACVKGMKGYAADRYKPSSNANYRMRYFLFTCQ